VRLQIAAQQSGIGSTVQVQLISFNDFHGYIKGGEGSSANQIGRAHV
jgi:5'-nucleotidase